MATVGPLNGTKLVLLVGGTAIAGTTSHSLSVSHAGREATTKDSQGYREILEGLREWNVSFDGLMSFDAAYGYEELFDLWVNRTRVALNLTTQETGDSSYTGNAYLGSLDKDGGVEETTTYNGTFEGTGALTRQTTT